MKFTKMHGLGNDYIYIDNTKEKRNDYEKLAIELSKRHFSIGADGIITIDTSTNADFYMQIYNADGSKGEMCGNGIRCVGKYVYENGMTDKKEITIETLSGIKKLSLNTDTNNKVSSVKVDMGNINDFNKTLELKDISHTMQVNGNNYTVVDISVGNPHAIIFTNEITDNQVLKDGPIIEKDSYYPNRTNVEFIKIINDNEIQMRVWERGSGETLACGTGSCASAIAYMLKKGSFDPITVHLIGGDLKISLENNQIIMEGPATKVYDGEIELD